MEQVNGKISEKDKEINELKKKIYREQARTKAAEMNRTTHSKQSTPNQNQIPPTSSTAPPGPAPQENIQPERKSKEETSADSSSYNDLG